MNRRGFLSKLVLGGTAAAATTVVRPEIQSHELDWFHTTGQSPECKTCGYIQEISSYSNSGELGNLWITEHHRVECPRYNHVGKKRLWSGK